MLAQQRDGTFYVDKDGNGAQSDMPFEYCVITIYTVNTGDGTENIRALAFAFDIVTGNVKVKRVNVVGSSRDYPWVDLYTSAMLTNSAQLSALASALGVGKTVLSQGADLNTIIDSGIYSSDSNIGGTLINSPSTGIQVMIAYRATASYLVQVIFSYSSNNAHFRIAYNANGTPVFTDWHQL